MNDTEKSPASQPAPPAAPPFGTPISLEQAHRVLAAIQKRVAELNVPNGVAIVEPSGDLVLFAKMDGAPYSAIQLAQQKAVCAARYRRPTDAFFEHIEAGHAFFLTFPGVIAAPGGVPIVHHGKLIGALGVSGGNRAQDLAVSDAGLAALQAEPHS